MPRQVIVVPCRLESTRFPRKLLHNIRGQPLVLWVARRLASETPGLPVFYAVDHPLLQNVLQSAGFEVVMTRPDHPSGTDRIAEANRVIGAEQVINVQGDEPLVSRAQLETLSALISGPAEMATLATPFATVRDWQNPNQVKVVCGRDGRALYFSRSPVPYPREAQGLPDEAWIQAQRPLRHLGMYAYKAGLLAQFASLPPGRWEQVEKLEQLRVLENGFSIAVGISNDPSIGVDVPEDAEKFERALGAG
jgi:3-deoxy-manno-octulosonate cytidylyltransferase (CMP-KDO synthetase)